MVVSFHRGARGQNALRQILAPVVKEIMDDKTLNIKTDPVDIYKSWVNQMETQTGEARWAAGARASSWGRRRTDEDESAVGRLTLHKRCERDKSDWFLKN